MGRIRTVGLVVKRDRPRAVRLARRMVTCAAAPRRRACWSTPTRRSPGLPARPKAALAREADLIVVLGGDGTLLVDRAPRATRACRSSA